MHVMEKRGGRGQVAGAQVAALVQHGDVAAATRRHDATTGVAKCAAPSKGERQQPRDTCREQDAHLRHVRRPYLPLQKDAQCPGANPSDPSLARSWDGGRWFRAGCILFPAARASV